MIFMPKKMRHGHLLLVQLRKRWIPLLVLTVVLFAGLGANLFKPYLLGHFIDTAQKGVALSALLLIAFQFLGVALLAQILTTLETYMAERIGLQATNRLRADLLLHCLRLDPTFYQNYTPGMLIERVDGDVNMLGNFFSRFVIALIGNALLLIGILVILFTINWRIGMSMTVFSLVALLLLLYLRKYTGWFWIKAREAMGEVSSFLEEHLNAVEDIRPNGAVDYVLLGLHKRARAAYRSIRAANLVSMAGGTGLLFFTAVGSTLALILGILLFQTGAISQGMVYTIFAYTVLLAQPIEQIVSQMQDFQTAVAGLQRVEELWKIRSMLEEGQGTPLPSGALSMSFDDVSFCYTAESYALRHVSLTIPAGSVLGLLGRTGSGKTTLAKLVARLYDPDEGVIRLAGVDLREPYLQDVHSRVGMVTQDIQLFHATVRDNLTFFDPTIPDERLLQVLHELGLGNWYQELSQGLDTLLAPGGGNLSTGEAQLLAFARIFLKDPGVVILDETSAHLDPATERQIENAIDRLLKGRTAIIIAHRLRTLQRADTIMILEQGCCCEYGPREKLASDPSSRFSCLLRVGSEEVLL